jgi:hypothetical protein
MRLSFNKGHEELWERFDSGPDIFLDLSFKGARFDGKAIFSGRLCEETLDFTNAFFVYHQLFLPLIRFYPNCGAIADSPVLRICAISGPSRISTPRT